MRELKRYSLQKRRAVNRGILSKFLSLLLLILISLLVFGVNPTTAQDSTNTYGLEEKKDQILIFVSFSMPDPALQSYYHETQALGGKLVMRGLKNNSFKDTQVKTMKLGINFDIDPTLFEEYGITTVPTIVFISGKIKQSNEPRHQLNSFKKQDIKKITGHIPLIKALEIMEKEI